MTTSWNLFREIAPGNNHDWPWQRRQGSWKGRRQEASQGLEGQHSGEVTCICAPLLDYSLSFRVSPSQPSEDWREEEESRESAGSSMKKLGVS